MSASRRVALPAGIALLLAACSAQSATPSSSATLAPSPTASQPTATSSVVPLTLVGLGDSIPGAAGCEGCSYVIKYGDLAARAL
ncbi:MAG: hypothetical protein OEW24_07230, partial [Chloroflexota bacterium]|nr:hypothetical protein [Chloroflexota bacterium]